MPKLTDLITRTEPRPPSAGVKLPWHEPEFSARMLREHLSQDHDAASRRSEVIDDHVAWLHTHIRAGKAGRVLDLGCGPGLYCARLTKLGHTCLGIDYSPASIEHARRQAEAHGDAIEYRLAEIGAAELGTDHDLALLIFGELNTFSPTDVARLFERVARALAPAGRLVLELSADAWVRDLAESPPTWTSRSAGLFSDRPHLLLTERSWSETERATTTQYHVIDAETAEVTHHAETHYAATQAEYEAMLRSAGFDTIERHPSLRGTDEPTRRQPELYVLVATRSH